TPAVSTSPLSMARSTSSRRASTTRPTSTWVAVTTVKRSPGRNRNGKSGCWNPLLERNRRHVLAEPGWRCGGRGGGGDGFRLFRQGHAGQGEGDCDPRRSAGRGGDGDLSPGGRQRAQRQRPDAGGWFLRTHHLYHQRRGAAGELQRDGGIRLAPPHFRPG